MRTVEDVLRVFGPKAEEALRARFGRHRLKHPPGKIALLAFKKEKRLELWAEDSSLWRLVHEYPILGASGMAGPKLREGDLQVPEGLYRISLLNPNSAYHLSMKVDYPNAFDRTKAEEEGRGQLGGDIFLHGKEASVGCLALGDEAIEELFVLVAQMGKESVEVIVAPQDFRKGEEALPLRYEPPWLDELYGHIKNQLRRFPVQG